MSSWPVIFVHYSSDGNFEYDTEDMFFSCSGWVDQWMRIVNFHGCDAAGDWVKKMLIKEQYIFDNPR